MLVASRGALLVATASLATGLLAGPSAAFAADPSTALSAAEMSTALKAVTAASTRAAAKGWKAAVKMTGDSLSGSESFIVDPAAGVAFQRFAIGSVTVAQYVAAGRGTYANLSDPTSRAAVKMMHRPSVRYAFTADKSVKLDNDSIDGGISPASLLADGVDHAGTRTTHDDGSADYRISQDGATLTAHVTAAGVLTSADVNGDGMHEVFSYAYGPQHVTLPPASATISSTTLAHGLAYLGMDATVREVAGESATDTLRAAHGHPVSLSSLRKVTQRDVTAANAGTGLKMLKTRSVRGGVRVYATNPWTHRTVSYTLNPSGRKVAIDAK
jgi:hypothetical protein